MNKPTAAQVWAFGRHVGTAAASVVATLVVTNLITPEEAKTTTSAFDQISTGIKDIIAGITALIPLVTALYAALSASPLWQAISAAHLPKSTIDANPQIAASLTTAAAKVEGTTVVTTPAVASASPAANVISNETNKVVDKGAQE